MRDIPMIRQPFLKRSGSNVAVTGYIAGVQKTVQAEIVVFNSDGSVTAKGRDGKIYGLLF